MPVPRKLSPAQIRQRNAADRDLRGAFAPHVASLKRAERGKLADFKLFGPVATVWVLSHRERPTRSARKVVDEATQQVDSERAADIAIAVDYLSKRLIEAILKDDAETFRKVADTIEFLRFDPHPGERIAPFDRLDRAILTYVRSHGVGNIAELRRAISKRMRWQLDSKGYLQPAHDKQLRNHCRQLGLKITRSKPGPKSKR